MIPWRARAGQHAIAAQNKAKYSLSEHAARDNNTRRTQRNGSETAMPVANSNVAAHNENGAESDQDHRATTRARANAQTPTKNTVGEMRADR